MVFHDRRLQYTEHQQLEGWKWNRPGDRLLDIGNEKNAYFRVSPYVHLSHSLSVSRIMCFSHIKVTLAGCSGSQYQHLLKYI